MEGREKRRMVRVRGREKFGEYGNTEGNMGIRKGKEENRKE